MPILSQIQGVVNKMADFATIGKSAPTFLYGTALEVNKLLDDCSFPVVFLYPCAPSNVNFTLSNAISETFNITVGFIFNKNDVDDSTVNVDSNLLLAENMSNEFLVRLKEYRETPLAARYFRIKNLDISKRAYFYNKFDTLACGITITILLNTMNNDNISLP